MLRLMSLAVCTIDVIILGFACGGVIQNEEGDFRLVIMHNNDMHSRVTSVNAQSSARCQDKVCYGGFARVRAASKRLREEYESKGWQVLFLNAGDNFQGSPYFTIHGWSVFADLIPLLKFDAMSLGNHEFDKGPKFLHDYMKSLKTPPVLACNVDTSADPDINDYTFKKSEIFEKNGKKIGIVGYLTPETKHLAQTGDVVIGEEITQIEEEVERLKKEGVEIIIALGHSGYKKDLEIAEKVHDVDLVVGGHTNTFLFNGKKPSEENVIDVYPKMVKGRRIEKDGRLVDVEVPVVQAYAYTKYLGVLEISFDSNGVIKKAEGNPILLGSDKYPEEDPEVVEKVTRWRKEIDEMYTKIVGYSEVPLEGEAIVCRQRECNLGNLMGDALVDYLKHKSDSKYKDETFISFFQSGSIRANMSKGEISYGDLLSAFPFDNEVIAVKITGDLVRRCLEQSVRTYELDGSNPLGNFLQVSGIKVVYDVTKRPLERVKSSLIRCNKRQLAENPECQKNDGYAPLDLKADYMVVTLSEMLAGGDGFSDLAAEHLKLEGFKKSQLQVLEAYLEKHPKVEPIVEERTIFHLPFYSSLGN